MDLSWTQKTLIVPLGLSVLLSSLGTSLANLALPAIAADFGASPAGVRWVVLSYLLSTTLFSLLMGGLGDTMGRRRVLIAGSALFAGATLMSGLSGALDVLLFARALQGVGAAALLALPLAIATGTAGGGKTGRIIGGLSTMSAIGTAAGPPLGGLLLQAFGWRSVFFVMAGLALINLSLLLAFAGREEPTNDRRPPKLREALPTVSALASRLLPNLAVSAVMMSTLIAGPFYLTRTLRLDSVNLGLAMSAGPLTSVIAGITTGSFVDRKGAKAVLRFGLIQLLIGAMAFLLLPARSGALGFAVSAALLSLGYQAFLSANSSLLMKEADPENGGIAAGALNLSRNLGLIIGTFVTGSLLETFASTSQPSPAEIARGFLATFVAGAFVILILIITELRKPPRRKHEPEHSS